MLIGYARVSTIDQNLDLQKDVLQEAGCERIFEDTISRTRAERPGLTKKKEQLRSEDTLVVWRFDRLVRTLRNLIEWITWLESKGIAFKSLQESKLRGRPDDFRRKAHFSGSPSLCLEL